MKTGVGSPKHAPGVFRGPKLEVDKGEMTDDQLKYVLVK